MYKSSKLKNGITLITVPVVGTKATTVLAMFPVGSRYETKDISGISHFVEHMMFKGTLKRPTAQDLSKTLEFYGADYNAFTYKDYTGYYVKIDGAHQEVAFDLLADMIFHSKVEAEEVEKEKGAIVEELRMYRDNPTMYIDILADQVTFSENPLGWDIGGTEETVRGISRATLWSFYQRHYAPQNMVLVVAGNINKARLKKFIHYFESQQSPITATKASYYKTNYPKFVWPATTPALVDRVRIAEKTVDQAHMIITFPGLKAHHPDRFALGILLNILGSGMSSRLFVEVRERRGLAYMVRSGSSSYRDVGVWYIQAGLDPARLAEAIAVIRREVEKMAREPVTKDEIEKAKNNLSGAMALGMEDSSSQAQWYAKYHLFAPDVLTYEQVVAKFKKVTATQVLNVAKKLLRWQEMRFALISPFSKEKVLEMLSL